MRELAIFMNTPKVGGAERSMVHQAKLLNKENPNLKIKFYIPFIEHKREANDFFKFLATQGFEKDCVTLFQFHSGLYGVSRSGKFFNLINILIGLFYSLYSIRRLKLSDDILLWGNGNKISVLLSLYILFHSQDLRLIWHWRDYPPRNGIFHYLIRFLNQRLRKTITHVGNSFDVTQSLSDFFDGNARVKTVYNPVGENIDCNKQRTKSSFSIGIVAMFSEWKGVHDAITLFSLYEEEFRAMNIDKIKIYGGEIYKTDGGHNNITDQYKELINKYDSTFFSFEGLKDPTKIYSEIDCLFHTSNRAEPFGRVLVEACMAKVPVVSTGLGGAGELVTKNNLGWAVKPYDYYGQLNLFSTLFKMIQCHDQEFQKKIEDSYSFAINLNNKVTAQLKEVLL
ncbi:MAG: glycosyltransferase family 4 protein [Oligoflexia bacterium]|nr:glycosyltransferase family 4 protein [Oligoflexia bacterium]